MDQDHKQDADNTYPNEDVNDYNIVSLVHAKSLIRPKYMILDFSLGITHIMRFAFHHIRLT